MSTATATKERPIMFSGPMVRAILDGRKTMTRRAVNPQPREVRVQGGEWLADDGCILRCRYGMIADRLWVKETWQPFFKGGAIYLADAGTARLNAVNEEHAKATWPKWKSSLFMPRSSSRVTLEITGVRVERLQDISEEDAKAEGIYLHSHHGLFSADHRSLDGGGRSAREGFAKLWDSINGKGAWRANPWVWAIRFARAAS